MGTAPATTPPSVLEVRDLEVSYGSTLAVQGVSLDVPRGAITAVIGPSGCGKSSFLAALNRMTDLLPDCQVRGEVHLDGEPLHGAGVDLIALRRRVGMIFQQPSPFPLSIRRNLDLPLRERGVRCRDRREEILEAKLREVGLWEEVRTRLDAPAPSLSGGQQQRLCMARCLAMEPEVLLFDEPCSALDPLASAVVEDLIARLRNRASIVIVTHNLAQARRLADHVAVFWHDGRAGRLIESGPAAQIFARPRHEVTRAYLEGARG